jgi:hypothetical protein
MPAIAPAHLVAAALLAACTPCPPVVPQQPARAVPAGDSSLRATLARGGVDPDRLECNTTVRWEPRLDAYAAQVVDGIARIWSLPSLDPARRKQARHHALGYLVRSYFEQARHHNLGAVLLRGHHYLDAQGRAHPLIVFRSGLIVGEQGKGEGASRCFRTLIAEGGVRHVFNLYTGTFPFRDLIAAEKQLATRLGATYLDANDTGAGNWRQLVEEEKDYRKNIGVAMRRLAGLVRGILRPGGVAPRGNIYFHCGGGMHRSGMVFGLLRRCINGDPLDAIEAEYKRHTGWSSPSSPGGYEALNMQLIREFDCSLLTAPASQESAPRPNGP